MILKTDQLESSTILFYIPSRLIYSLSRAGQHWRVTRRSDEGRAFCKGRAPFFNSSLDSKRNPPLATAVQLHAAAFAGQATCHILTANRLIAATTAIFLCLGFFAAMRSYTAFSPGSQRLRFHTIWQRI